MADKQMKITLRRSLIGASNVQKKVAKALGFSRINQTVVHNDSDTIKGMVNKISHLVSVD